MTDLIDKAALRNLLFGRAMGNPTATVTIAAEVLDDIFRMVPTVECAACEYGRIGTFDQSIVHCALNHGESRGRTWFCGDFKRRQA